VVNGVRAVCGRREEVFYVAALVRGQQKQVAAPPRSREHAVTVPAQRRRQNGYARLTWQRAPQPALLPARQECRRRQARQREAVAPSRRYARGDMKAGAAAAACRRASTAAAIRAHAARR